jgi:hypothetical protein
MVRASAATRGRGPASPLFKPIETGADGSAMDEFNFGGPGRRGPRVSLDPRLLVAIGGLLAAGLAVYGFLTFVSKSGHEVAHAQATVVQQVDHSQDAAAQTTLQGAMAAAKTIFLDDTSYAGMNPAALAEVEPSLTYTDGPSPALPTISVASTPTAVGLAVMSASGTCFYMKDDAAAGTTYGSGTTCTGQAALSAAAPSW